MTSFLNDPLLIREQCYKILICSYVLALKITTEIQSEYIFVMWKMSVSTQIYISVDSALEIRVIENQEEANFLVLISHFEFHFISKRTYENHDLLLVIFRLVKKLF